MIATIIPEIMKNILFAGLLILCGCATGSHVITGNARPIISPDAVKVYAAMPENAEIIGILACSDPARYKQQGMNSTLKRMKIEAANIGANGVVITSQENNGWTGTKLNGTAIFVP